MRFELIDTTVSMGMGWLVNSAMILVAAAVFYANGITVDSIVQASQTLQPLVGSLARLLFGLALLVAGISSAITSSLATANVVSGYLGRPEDPRSCVYRVGLVVLAVPAVVLIDVGLDPFRALILSQVVLSIQLPLTIIPLLVLSRRERVMGAMRMGTLSTVTGWLVAGVIIALNVFLLYQTLGFEGG
jgi:manganese transport protein